MQRAVKNRIKTYFLIINLISSLLVSGFASATGHETKVLLCTSQGYQWITIETEQEPQLNSSIGADSHCMTCLASGNDNDAYLCADNYPELVSTQVSFSYLTDNLFYQGHLLSAVQARAPPSFI